MNNLVLVSFSGKKNPVVEQTNVLITACHSSLTSHYWLLFRARFYLEEQVPTLGPSNKTELNFERADFQGQTNPLGSSVKFIISKPH